MQYFGGKARVAKELSKFINQEYLDGNNTPFVDLFCGSCNVSVKINKDREVIANDKHFYLIKMWKELQNGWKPPKECTRKQYEIVRDKVDVKPHVSGFIGFGCSFAGKWWGGYAKSNTDRNYCLNNYNSTMKKLKNLTGVKFQNKDYFDLAIPTGAVVYCDKPYEDTTAYCKKEVGEFDNDKFYDWCKENKNNYTILISEYKHNVREGFEIVWEKDSKQDIRSCDGKSRLTVEVVMTPIREVI